MKFSIVSFSRKFICLWSPKDSLELNISILTKKEQFPTVQNSACKIWHQLRTTAAPDNKAPPLQQVWFRLGAVASKDVQPVRHPLALHNQPSFARTTETNWKYKQQSNQNRKNVARTTETNWKYKQQSNQIERMKHALERKRRLNTIEAANWNEADIQDRIKQSKITNQRHSNWTDNNQIPFRQTAETKLKVQTATKSD